MNRDVAKISAVLKPMKCDYYVVTFWQESEQVYFLGVKGLNRKILLYDRHGQICKILFYFNLIILRFDTTLRQGAGNRTWICAPLHVTQLPRLPASPLTALQVWILWQIKKGKSNLENETILGLVNFPEAWLAYFEYPLLGGGLEGFVFTQHPAEPEYKPESNTSQQLQSKYRTESNTSQQLQSKYRTETNTS